MPIRTWDCLNRNCRERFDSERDYPACPACRSARLKWVPVQVNMNTKSMVADKDVRDLSEIFGLTDMNSPMRDRAAKKVVPQTRFEPWTAKDGWTIPLAKDPDGRPLATCAPAGITSKVTGKVSERASRFQGSQLGGGPRPVVEASHRPGKGRR